jgi:hypothetical protein
MSFRLTSIVTSAFASALLACGGSAPPPEPPPSESMSPESSAASSASDAADPAAPTGSEGPSDGLPSPPSGPAEAETRTTEVIAKTIRDNRQPFRDCFEKGLKEAPDLKGTMTLHFVLDPNGSVKLAELNEPRSDVKLPIIVDCALAVLRAMKFPPSSRGMESVVNYPFDFKN